MPWYGHGIFRQLRPSTGEERKRQCWTSHPHSASLLQENGNCRKTNHSSTAGPSRLAARKYPWCKWPRATQRWQEKGCSSHSSPSVPSATGAATNCTHRKEHLHGSSALRLHAILRPSSAMSEPDPKDTGGTPPRSPEPT